MRRAVTRKAYCASAARSAISASATAMRPSAAILSPIAPMSPTIHA